MTQLGGELLIAFELHSVERIRATLDAGLDVRAPLRQIACLLAARDGHEIGPVMPPAALPTLR